MHFLRRDRRRRSIVQFQKSKPALRKKMAARFDGIVGIRQKDAADVPGENLKSGDARGR
jgi:hypothetical protein